MFTSEQMRIIRFCAEECIRQGKRDPMSTYDMVAAWDQAIWYQNEERAINLEFIETLGKLTEPTENFNGFRQKRIFVGNVEKAPWDRVPELLSRLIEAYYEDRLYPINFDYIRPDSRSELSKAKSEEDVFYWEYENIHPFRDGNGRTGKILYNYLRDSLNDPQMPPNFWNISNP